MARQVFRNNVFTKLAGAITDSQTVFAVADGSVLYSPSANERSVITLQSKNIRSQVEVVQLLSVAGNNVTVVRGIEGAQFAFSANDIVEQRVTAGSLDNFLQTEDVTTSDTAPVNPRKNQRWVDGTDGVEYFWYDNGISQQWVEIGTQVYGTNPAPPPAVTAYDIYQDQQTALVAADVLTVSGDAAAAQATADGAVADAAAAQAAADGAVADAAAAQATADGAVADAAAAQATADGAVADAAAAQATADGADTKADNNSACLGVSNAAHLGSFTGSLFLDDQTVKSVLQVTETRLEQAARIFNCTLNGVTGTPSGGPDGFTFSDMNDLLAAMPDDSTINVEVVNFLCTWDATPVTRKRCEINININYYGDATERGIKITSTTGSTICALIDCDVTIRGEEEQYSVIRLIAGASNINISAIAATKSRITLENLTVQFANSAAHALGCGFILFSQGVGNARISNVTAEWDPVFTPVPNTNGIYVVKAGTTGESWADHDLDISYFELAAATATYYKGATNRKYISDVFNSASPAPHTLVANSKLTFDLATSGRVMQRITSGMLILTCTSTDQGYAVGEILYLAIGAPGSSVASDMGAFISADLAGTQQIATITLTIGQGGLSYVRDTAAYTVVALALTKWDAQLYCRDES